MEELQWYGHPQAHTATALSQLPESEWVPAEVLDTQAPIWLISRLPGSEVHTGHQHLRSPTLQFDSALLYENGVRKPLNVRVEKNGFATSAFRVPTTKRILLRVRPLQFSEYHSDIRLESPARQQADYRRFVRITGLLSGMVLFLFLLAGIGRLRHPVPLSLLLFLPTGLLLIWAYDGFFWQYPAFSVQLVSGLLLLKGGSWLFFWSGEIKPSWRQQVRWGLALAIVAVPPLFLDIFSLGWTLVPLVGWWGAGMVVLGKEKKWILLGAQLFLFLMTLHLSLWTLGITGVHPFLSLSWGTLFVGQASLGVAALFVHRAGTQKQKEAQIQKDVLQSRLEGLQQRVQEQDKRLQQHNERIERQEKQLIRQQEDLHARTQLLKEKDRHFQEASQRLQEQKEELELQNEEVLMKSSLIEAQKDLAAQTYKQIKLLRDIGQQLNSSLDMNEILTTAYQNIHSFVDAEGIGIGVYRPKRQEVHFLRFWWKGEPEKRGTISLYRRNKLLDFALRDNRELLIKEFDKDYQKYMNEPAPTNEEAPQSAIYLPLTARREVMGVLILQHSQKNAFTYEQLDMLKSLGQFLAVGMDNAQAYRKIQDINEQMNDKNYQIMSSLRYAQTVQRAILPQTELLEELFTAHFVIFMPRDLVSGDFYWLTRSDEYTFVAVVDCTGHGVPGAFMSMVGHSLLNQIINEQKIYGPANILTELDRGVRHLLQQNQGQNTDGMDLALCRIKPASDPEEPTLVCFSGAKSNIFYTEEGKVQLLRGDRLSIGGSRRRRKGTFTEEAFVLNAGEQIYMATDGYMDQHNSQKQKIGRHRFHDLLRELQHLPFTLQQYRLGEYLADHKQGEEQRDDITVLGVRP